MNQAPSFDHQLSDMLCDSRDGVRILTINRQKSYNSWTSALRDELARQLNAADSDSSVKAVVLTGAGTEAFCSGQDLSEIKEFENGQKLAAWFQRLATCYNAVRSFSKPLVAAVNGVAAGSGFQVIQFCDMAVAHGDVKMGQTEVNSGLPSVFGTWLLWERVGRCRAVEMSLQGRLMPAAEAHELGFIHKIVDKNAVVEEAIQAAVRLAQQPSMAYSLSKRAIKSFDEAGYLNALNLAQGLYEQAFDSGEPQKEIEKFFDRRAKRAQVARS